MENQQKNTFKHTLSTNQLIFSRQCQTLKFSVKNLSLKTTSFQIKISLNNHFKLLSQRTFTLAPGISKVCIIKHFPQQAEQQCSHKAYSIRVLTSEKEESSIALYCQQSNIRQQKIIAFPQKIQLGQVYENKSFKIPVENTCDSAIKVVIVQQASVNCQQKPLVNQGSLLISSLLQSMGIGSASQNNTPNRLATQRSKKYELELLRGQFVLLKDKKNIVQVSLKLYESGDFNINLNLTVTKQGKQNKPYNYIIHVKGSSFQKNQFVGGQNNDKIDTIETEIINGSVFKSHFYVYNQYHRDTTFSITPHIRSNKPSEFAARWKQHKIVFSPEQASIKSYSKCRVDYTIQTFINQDDQNFVTKYSKVGLNDDVLAFKMRKLPYFKKNSDMEIEIEFDGVSVQKILHKCSIINCAIRVEQQNNKIKFQNDSGLPIPFSFKKSAFFKTIPDRGVIQTKQISEILVSKKRQSNSYLIEMNLPQTVLLFDQKNWDQEQDICKSQKTLTRNKSAKINRSCSGNNLRINNVSTITRPISAIKNNVRPFSGISNANSVLRPISAINQSRLNFRKPKLIQKTDFLAKEPKYKKLQQISNEQLQNLQITYRNGANTIANTHPQKSMLLHFQDRGYLVIPSNHSYEIRQSFQQLKFKVNKQIFSLTKCPFPDNNDDKQFYLLPKQLVFNFIQQNKQVQLTRSVNIVNKSDYPIDVFCLTADNLYFTSKQQDNHVRVPSNTTGEYKIGFCPETTCTTKQTRITQTFEFSIEGHNQKVNLIGELLEVQCDYFPKLIKFQSSHLGEQETSTSLFITNSSYRRLFFQFQDHQVVRIQPKLGSIAQKTQMKFTVFFNPNRHHRDFQSYLKAYITGSHVLKIPLLINTLQPSVHIEEQYLNFGVGILKDELIAKITINNQDNSFCQVCLDFTNSQVFLKEENILGDQKIVVPLQPKSKQIVEVKITAAKQGSNRIELSEKIAQLVGYGPIPSPAYFNYTGKQTLLSITPNEHINYINLTQSNETFKFRLISLAPKKLKLKTELKSMDFDCKSLIVSCNPSNFELVPGEQTEVALNFIVIDMERVKKMAMDHMVIIYIGGEKYTQLQCKVTMPTPSLQLNPGKMILPTVGLNTWSSSLLKIVNKGFKEIYVKVVKPSNISFDFECNLSTNRLTRLHNEIVVPVMFRSKKKISFQINLEIIDNFNRNYCLPVSGTVTDSPLFIIPKQSNSNLTGSIQSFSTLSSSTGIPSQQEQEDIQFINKWLQIKFPIIKSEHKNFHLWIRQIPNFKLFISQFGVNLGKNIRDLPTAIQQLKKLGYQLNSLNLKNLIHGDSHDWLNFIWHFLSHQFISNQTLKWLESLCGISFDSYDMLILSYKKVLIDVWNRIYQGIVLSRVKQWPKICEKVYPYMNIFNDINNRKHLIVLMNQLYHKLAKPQRQVINTDDLNHVLIIQNLSSKVHINYWVIHGKQCQVSEENKKFQLFGGQKAQIKINIKSNCQLIILNDTFYEPIRIYQIRIFEHHPIVNQVNIQCEDKCSQQWTLDYVCPIQSPYKVDFTGDAEFRAKIPPLGILKQEQIITIRVFYAPTNLKSHSAKLTVSNKYSKQIYEIKGIPLCSQVVEMEKRINPIQGTVHKETIVLPWQLPPLNQGDLLQTIQTNSTNKGNIQIIEYNGQHSELLLAETEVSKVNRKEVKLKFEFQFDKIYRNLALLYQIISDDQTSKIVRFLVNVSPRPITVQVKVSCQIGSVVKQKIPLNNPLKVRDIVKIESASKSQQRGEFKLSKYGGIRLQPNDLQYVVLSYKPQSFSPCKTSYVFTYQQSGMVYNYNIIGMPEFPTVYPQPITIQCEVQESTKQQLRIQNKLREKIIYEVQTNLQQITGTDTLIAKPHQQNIYEFSVLSLHPGTVKGELVFFHQRFKIVYVINIITKNQKHFKKLKVSGQIRKSSKLIIQLQNKSDKDIIYDILCNSQFLQIPQKLTIPKKSSEILQIGYTPLFQGTKFADLKLFSLSDPQVVYRIQMKSEPHVQDIPDIQCDLGVPAHQKIVLKNPTKHSCTLSCNDIPNQLEIQPNNIQIQAGKSLVVNVTFKPLRLTSQFTHSLVLLTNNIGKFRYNLKFIINQEKVMQPIDVYYKSTLQSKILGSIVFQNRFENQLNCVVTDNVQGQIVYNTKAFKLTGYADKILKFQIMKQIRTNAKSQICIKDKNSNCQWIYPIRVIQLQQHPQNQTIQVKGNAQITAKAKVRNLVMRNIERISVDGIANQFFSAYFDQHQACYLEVLINKICTYNGQITFFNENRAQKYPLKLSIKEPKVETIYLYANIGEKSTLQLALKNGTGNFKVQIANNKNQQFNVYPIQGAFNGSNTSIHLEYTPKDYSGVKKARIAVVSQNNCNYFELIGKFPK